MTTQQIVEALKQIDSPQALPAAIEYELEDMGLIVQDHRPYAHLTREGRVFLKENQ